MTDSGAAIRHGRKRSLPSALSHLPFCSVLIPHFFCPCYLSLSTRAFEMCDVLPTSADVQIDDKSPVQSTRPPRKRSSFTNPEIFSVTYSPPGVWTQFDSKRFKDGSQHLTRAIDAQFTVKFNGTPHLSNLGPSSFSSLDFSRILCVVCF